MPNDTDQLTAATSAPTDEGKGTEQSGKDPVVSGLTSRLNKEIALRQKAEQDRAELIAKLGQSDGTEVETLRKENSMYKVASKYPDISGTLLKAFEKGALNPEFVDDDFAASIRAAQTGQPVAVLDESGVPPHNPVKQSGSESPEAILKRMTSLWPDDE